MPFKKNIMGTGGGSGVGSQALVGEVDGSVTATGSTSQANSYLIVKPNTIVTTTAANTGVRLPSTLSAGDSGRIANHGASTLFIYPPVGGAINAGTVDAKVDVATLKGADFVCIDGLNFSVIVGA